MRFLCSYECLKQMMKWQFVRNSAKKVILLPLQSNNQKNNKYEYNIAHRFAKHHYSNSTSERSRKCRGM
mgnify:CR=1 FL=1